MLAGAKSLTAIGEWAADAPGEVLVRLGVRTDQLTAAVLPPDESTVRKVLADIDGDALDQAVGAWLAGLVTRTGSSGRATHPTPGVAHPHRRQRPSHPPHGQAWPAPSSAA